MTKDEILKMSKFLADNADELAKYLDMDGYRCVELMFNSFSRGGFQTRLNIHTDCKSQYMSANEITPEMLNISIGRINL